MSPKLKMQGFFKFPSAVNPIFPSTIHVNQKWHMWDLNGLLRLTSYGCRSDIVPPTITAWLVYSLIHCALIESTRCALNISQTTNDFLLKAVPGLMFHTFSNHKSNPFSSHQPFGWTVTINQGKNFSFSKVLHMKITNVFNLAPLTIHARMTVKWCFSTPQVFINTVLSKYMGVSSILPINNKSYWYWLYWQNDECLSLCRRHLLAASPQYVFSAVL